MIQIHSIDISYFRSIHRQRIANLKDLSVFAGKNDVGKSNVLKALNLFFNNETDWHVPLNFVTDFNAERLSEVRQDTIKGKQFIKIKVGFIRGERFEKSLPKRFSVTRTWHRASSVPDTRHDLSQQFKKSNTTVKALHRAEASLQRYLNTVRYEYIPTIKDREFYDYMLTLLQDRIFDDKQHTNTPIESLVTQLNDTVSDEAQSLESEFQAATGVFAAIRLPNQLSGLFRAFNVETQLGDIGLPLTGRGDGIRSRFLPSLLNYVSERSNRHFIWGFEEPENSLEYALSTKLAQDMADEYSKSAQIVMTSHSPAFFSFPSDIGSIYRVSKSDDRTKIYPIDKKSKGDSDTDVRALLEKELGLMEFQEKWHREYEQKLALIDSTLNEINSAKAKIDENNSPALMTEGQWDVETLTTAWTKLYPGVNCPFRILPCDTNPDDPSASAAGVGTLLHCIKTHRPDEPIVIGLFDRDQAGYDLGFQKLDNNFSLLAGSKDVSLQKAGAAGAIVLPIIKGREEYAKVKNLVLEFYFDDKWLETEIDGRKLEWNYPHIEEKIVPGNIVIKKELSSEPHHRIPTAGGKKIFATKIIPALPEEAFTHFEQLFDLIKATIRKLEIRRNGK